MCWFGVWMAAAIGFTFGFIVCAWFITGTKSEYDSDGYAKGAGVRRATDMEPSPRGSCLWCGDAVKGGVLFCSTEHARNWQVFKKRGGRA